MKQKFTKAHIVKQDQKSGTFTAIASTATVDRHGEIVSPEGWDLANFKKNPVLLWSHDHTIPAIGKATKIWVEGFGESAKLMFEGIWQTVTEEGKAAAQLVAEGILNSFSVGFIPTDMVGNTYTQQQLLEISLVNVPANPDAVMRSYKSLKENGFSEEVAKNVTRQFANLSTVRKDLFTDQKGALQDELDAEAVWEAKCHNMNDVWDIMFALCDVYYDEKTPVDAFGGLVKEMIGLLEKVATGTYEEPEVEDDTTEEKEVIDNHTKKPEDETNKAKVPPATAPPTPSKDIRKRQSLAKAIIRASEKLLADQGSADTESVKQIKAIKRAGEILSQHNKGEIHRG